MGNLTRVRVDGHTIRLYDIAPGARLTYAFVARESGVESDVSIV